MKIINKIAVVTLAGATLAFMSYTIIALARDDSTPAENILTTNHKNLSALASADSLTHVGRTPKYSGRYYPNAEPSDWYILPGQEISFSGRGFAPNEIVSVAGAPAGTSIAVKANSAGSFSSSGGFIIPYEWGDSSRSFLVKGNTSGALIPIKITVGTFYPQITPSAWWVKQGASVSVSGKSFAPGEQVRLYVNGMEVARVVADNSGNVHFNVSVPTSGSSAILVARGFSSGTTSVRTIFLH